MTTIFYKILFDLISILKNKIFLNNLIIIKNIFYERAKLVSAAIYYRFFNVFIFLLSKFIIFLNVYFIIHSMYTDKHIFVKYS